MWDGVQQEKAERRRKQAFCWANPGGVLCSPVSIQGFQAWFYNLVLHMFSMQSKVKEMSPCASQYRRQPASCHQVRVLPQQRGRRGGGEEGRGQRHPVWTWLQTGLCRQQQGTFLDLHCLEVERGWVQVKRCEEPFLMDQLRTMRDNVLHGHTIVKSSIK